MSKTDKKEKQYQNQNKCGSGQVFLDKRFESLKRTSIFLFPIVTFLAFRAQDIVPSIFGEASKTLVFPFQIIVWGVILIYCNSSLLAIALFLNRKLIVYLSLAILALYAVVLNSGLIPSYGLEGVCAAIIISLAAMFVFTVSYLEKTGIKLPLYKSFEKPAVATMGMTLIMHYTDTQPFPLALFFGVAGYFLILAITCALDK